MVAHEQDREVEYVPCEPRGIQAEGRGSRMALRPRRDGEMFKVQCDGPRLQFVNHATWGGGHSERREVDRLPDGQEVCEGDPGEHMSRTQLAGDEWRRRKYHMPEPSPDGDILCLDMLDRSTCGVCMHTNKCCQSDSTQLLLACK